MFDPKCFDLAEEFLDDGAFDGEDVDELAQQIQDTIEDFIAAKKDVENIQ